MDLSQVKEKFGDAFWVNVVQAANNHDHLRQVIAYVVQANKKMTDRPVAFNVIYNLIRFSAAQQTEDPDQRLTIASGMVKLLKASDALEKHYLDALEELFVEAPYGWAAVHMVPEPVRTDL